MPRPTPRPEPGPDDRTSAGRPAGTVRPRALLLACLLVLVEAAALAAAAVVGVVALLGGGDVGPVLFLVALALGVALLLATAARGLWAGRRWGRGPVLTAQIMVVVTAATWWGAGGGPWALVPVVVAVGVTVAVLLPSVVAVTSARGDALT